MKNIKKIGTMCVALMILLGGINTNEIRETIRKNANVVRPIELGGGVNVYVDPPSEFKTSEKFKNAVRFEGQEFGNTLKLSSDKYEYGLACLDYSGVYSYYDKDSNVCYVFCLATASIQPSQNSFWDQYGWYSKAMSLDVSIDYFGSNSNIKRGEFFPKTSENDYSESFSIGINAETSSGVEAGTGGISGNQSNSKGFSISYTSSVNYSSIQSSYYFYENPGKVTLEYDFTRYNKGSIAERNKDACHKGVVKSFGMIYIIKNFKNSGGLKSVGVNFRYKPLIFRDGRWNDSIYNENNEGKILENKYYIYY